MARQVSSASTMDTATSHTHGAPASLICIGPHQSRDPRARLWLVSGSLVCWRGILITAAISASR